MNRQNEIINALRDLSDMVTMTDAALSPENTQARRILRDYDKTQDAVYHRRGPNPWKEGFCDAVFGRDCKSPYLTSRNKSQLYLSGFLKGRESTKEMGAVECFS